MQPIELNYLNFSTNYLIFMASLLLEIKISGKGKILQFDVVLENDISVVLFTFDGGKTWSNRDIEIETDKDLDVFFFLKSTKVFDWEFQIIDQNTNKTIFEESGKIGDGDGKNSIPNNSNRTASVPVS